MKTEAEIRDKLLDVLSVDATKKIMGITSEEGPIFSKVAMAKAFLWVLDEPDQRIPSSPTNDYLRRK